MKAHKDRVPLEESIIGACLIERGYDHVGRILRHSDFQRPRNLIFTAFHKLTEAGDPIDLRTTNRILERNDQQVDPGYLVHCVLGVNSAANIRFHAIVLIEYALESEIVSLLNKYTTKGGMDGELASNCLQKIIEKPDVLVALELITAYTITRSPKSELTKKITELYTKFKERCQEIKSQM